MNNLYTKDLIPEKYRSNIGDYTYGNPQILEWGEGARLKIGKFCSIADQVVIFLGGNHRVDWVTTYPFNVLDWPEAKGISGHPATKGNVVIGNDVWIGYGVTILSGITIGDGAIIGARTVVTHNVDPYSVVVGNPGRQVKKRFDDQIIQKLLEDPWWNWPLEKIKKNIRRLCSAP
ncbi:MAG: CatB-related O-acetyltransferase [Patescibacteria group bacterium]|nr:CatB-related O-acetyltransferase [Patescibacteria group bacterium]